MSDFFTFEADFVDSLHCIPMQVRLKLDTCGVKLKLNHWNQFSDQERQSLVALNCTTDKQAAAYKEYLQNLVLQKTGSVAKDLPVEANPPWLDSQTIPERIMTKAQEFDVTISQQQWAQLTPLQRFALWKLSRPSHENRNFYPALQEFQLA